MSIIERELQKLTKAMTNGELNKKMKEAMKTVDSHKSNSAQKQTANSVIARVSKELKSRGI